MIKKEFYGLLFVLSLFLVSCDTQMKGISSVQLGMTKQTAVSILGTGYKVMTMAQTEQGNLEVLRYQKMEMVNAAYIEVEYYLHFLDGRLVELNRVEPQQMLPPNQPPYPHRN